MIRLERLESSIRMGGEAPPSWLAEELDRLHARLGGGRREEDAGAKASSAGGEGAER